MTRASARLATEHTEPAAGRPHTRISVLRSDWPLMLRTTSPLGTTPVTAWAGRTSGAARVHVAAGAAGPLGGDRLALDVRVGPSSALLLGEVAPTLLLPGPYGEESRLDIRIRVGTGAALAWLPELVIAGRGCRHVTDIRVVLEAGARLVLREEVLLGRHGEAPGAYRQRVRVEAEHGPVYDQEFGVGPAAIGWNGPAVTAGRRTAGTLIVVDPDLVGGGTSPAALRAHDTALMELPGGGVLVSTLAPETTALRRQLDHAMTHLLTRTAEQKPAVSCCEPARYAREANA